MATYVGGNVSAAVFIGLGKIPRVPSLVTDCSTMGEIDCSNGLGVTIVLKGVVDALREWCWIWCAKASHALLSKVSVADAVKNSCVLSDGTVVEREVLGSVVFDTGTVTCSGDMMIWERCVTVLYLLDTSAMMLELSHSSSMLKVCATSCDAEMATSDEAYVAVGIKWGVYSVASSEWSDVSVGYVM